MKGRIAVLAAILVFAGLVYESNGDCYMHNPRGSNNRLNERSANRNNANRLFDSQVMPIATLLTISDTFLSLSLE